MAIETWPTQQPQRQDSLADQLTDLHRVAARLGMYDAADWLWKASAGVAAGPQMTPQVLWEGDLGELMHAVNGTPILSALLAAFPADEPGQWQVRVQRVVAAPTGQEGDDGE